MGYCSGCCDQFIVLLTSFKDLYVLESEQQWIFGITVITLEHKIGGEDLFGEGIGNMPYMVDLLLPRLQPGEF